MKPVLESIMTCYVCKITDCKHTSFIPSDDVKKMARIAETGLFQKHIKESPRCIENLKISITSKIVDADSNNAMIKLVEPGEDIKEIIERLGDPRNIMVQLPEDPHEREIIEELCHWLGISID